jgi:hypothetical protein
MQNLKDMHKNDGKHDTFKGQLFLVFNLQLLYKFSREFSFHQPMNYLDSDHFWHFLRYLQCSFWLYYIPQFGQMAPKN